MSDIRPVGVDHVVLVVADVERSLAWYVDVLGGAPVRVEEWRAGGAPFPSVRLGHTAVLDIVARGRTRPNVGHTCLQIAPAPPDAPTEPDRVDLGRGPSGPFGAPGSGG